MNYRQPLSNRESDESSVRLEILFGCGLSRALCSHRSSRLSTSRSFGHNAQRRSEVKRMFGASIGRACQRLIDAMVRWLAYGHINPTILTIIGVALNVGCGLLFGLGHFFAGGIALIVANLFDMLDGQVARLSGRVTRFGGFLDSSLDRLSDMVVFVGLMVFYAREIESHSTLNVLKHHEA